MNWFCIVLANDAVGVALASSKGDAYNKATAHYPSNARPLARSIERVQAPQPKRPAWLDA